MQFMNKIPKELSHSMLLCSESPTVPLPNFTTERPKNNSTKIFGNFSIGKYTPYKSPLTAFRSYR